MQTHFKAPALLTLLCFATFVPLGLAQDGVSFRDDFSDMDLTDNEPVGWRPFTLGDQIDASSGDLVITTDSTWGNGFGIIQNNRYSDIRVETQLRVLDQNFERVGLGVRVTPGQSGYFGTISRRGLGRRDLDIFAVRDAPIPVATTPTNLDPTVEDIWLSFESNGDLLTLRAWSETSPIETLSVRDSRNQSGILGPGHWGSVNVEGSAFRYIEATLLDELFDCDSNGMIDIADLNCTVASDLSSVLNYTGLVQGDANGDGSVAFDDFLTLSGAFGTNGSYTDGDFDLSGTVDFGDFLILSANFGATKQQVAAVPESSSIASFLVGIVVLAMSRGRTRFAK